MVIELYVCIKVRSLGLHMAYKKWTCLMRLPAASQNSTIHITKCKQSAHRIKHSTKTSTELDNPHNLLNASNHLSWTKLDLRKRQQYEIYLHDDLSVHSTKKDCGSNCMCTSETHIMMFTYIHSWC